MNQTTAVARNYLILNADGKDINRDLNENNETLSNLKSGTPGCDFKFLQSRTQSLFP